MACAVRLRAKESEFLKGSWPDPYRQFFVYFPYQACFVGLSLLALSTGQIEHVFAV